MNNGKVMSDEMALDDADDGIDISADDIAPPRRAIRPDPDDDPIPVERGDVRHYPDIGYVVSGTCERCGASNEVGAPPGYVIRECSAREVQGQDDDEVIAVFEHLYNQARERRRHAPKLSWVGADDERESPGELFRESYKARLGEARTRRSPFS